MIRTEECGNDLVVRFDRPEIRNPLSVAVIEALLTIVDERAARGRLGKIVFTGRDGVFASGADLRQIAALTAADAADFARKGQRLMVAVSQLTTVAAIDGQCYGGALDLTLACGRRVASPRSTFCHPGARLGIITGWGGTQRLPRLIGEAAALEMFLTAEPITAENALRVGLIDELSDDPLASALANS
jgi:enoyl-CoA hydratase/carnithine racemase